MLLLLINRVAAAQMTEKVSGSSELKAEQPLSSLSHEVLHSLVSERDGLQTQIELLLKEQHPVEAKARYEDLIRLEQKIYGDESLAATRALDDLARLYLSQGDAKAAVSFGSRALGNAQDLLNLNARGQSERQHILLEKTVAPVARYVFICRASSRLGTRGNLSTRFGLERSEFHTRAADAERLARLARRSDRGKPG